MRGGSKRNRRGVWMEIFDDRENEYRAWLLNNSDGYVVNSRKRIDKSYLILHRSTCGSISSEKIQNYTTTSYFKICSVRVGELEKWAREMVNGTLKKCRLCKP